METRQVLSDQQGLTSQPRSGIRFVAALHRVRTIGTLIALLGITPTLLAEHATSVVVVSFVTWCLVWPHIAYQISRKSLNPVAAERRNMMLDAGCAGMVVASLGFRLMPSVIVLLSVGLNNIAVGGMRLLVAGGAASVAGMAVSLLFFGVRFEPWQEHYSTYAMLPMLVIYPLLIGKFAYGASVRLSDRTRQLKILSEKDALTGLMNRTTFVDALDNVLLRHGQTQPGVVGVLFIDLDNFKTVNDSLGHKTGDKVLLRLSERLARITESGGLTGRYGGDEFVAAIRASSPEAMTVFASEVIGALSRDVSVDGTLLRFGATVGISLFPLHARNAASLISFADLAMYQAKKAGKGTFRLFDEHLAQTSALKHRLARQLRVAIQSDLEVHFQPQIDIATGKLAGVEALARWHDPELGEISPSVFIPIAEEMGLIAELGAEVLDTACMHAAQWRDRLGTPIRVSVNVSALQLRRQEFADRVVRAINRYEMDPSYLELEITESTLLDSAGETQTVLKKLETLGVRMAVDDFGMGYSNLSCLHALRIDRLKIDRSFIDTLFGTASSQPIVTAVIAMARALQLDVVAEGVETRDQAAWLAERGCSIGQGYYYCRAVPAADFEGILRRSAAEEFVWIAASRNGTKLDRLQA